MIETGVGIQSPHFFIGVVENNVDQRLEGRVQVRAFGIHGTVDEVPTASLPWATLIHGSYDPNSPLPPINSWVFGFFLDGRDAQQPMILGLIPTQYTEELNPTQTGWGVIPQQDGDLLALGSRPNDFGQPMNSRLSRGENIEDTYVLSQETNRRRHIAVGGDSDGTLAWSEPASAYGTEYPFNRVIETPGGHSIEMDDTPGAERITINHQTGSYVAIDSRGTMTIKSISDSYQINNVNAHVYVGGRSMVTIDGDSHVLVKGNKTEEIIGNFSQLIHGNHILSVAGQSNINASDEIQMRAAKLRIESNIENLNIKTGKSIFFETNESLHLKAATGIYIQSDSDLHLKSENSYFNSSSDLNITSNLFNMEASSRGNIKASDIRIGGGSKVSLKSSVVAIDDFAYITTGNADTPSGALSASNASSPEVTNLPEPVQKSITLASSNYRNFSSIGSSGYASRDNTGIIYNENLDTTYSKTTLAPLLDLIGRAEGAGYDTIYGGSVVQPNIPITLMSISELIEWQSRSVSSGSISSAAGRYQVLRKTLESVLSSTSQVSYSDRYSPSVQDTVGTILLNKRGLNAFLSGNITKEEFGNNLSQEWASFPVITGPSAGYSYYQGIAGNKSRIAISDVMAVLDEVKNRQSSGENVS